MLLKMAWRNLWRHTRRTLITTATVAFGLWLAVTFSAMAEHSYTTMIDTGARMGAGHVTVQPKGYLEEPGLDKTIGDMEAVRAKAAALPHVASAVPRVTGQAMFTVGGRSRGGQFVAIDPRYETEASNALLGAVAEGQLFDDPDARAIVIGRELAEKLDVGLGKKVVYTTTDKSGEMVSEVGRVSGIFDSGVPEVDLGVVLLPIGRVRKALGYGPDEGTQVAIMADNQRFAEPIRDQLRPHTPDGGVTLSWQESMADMVGFIALDRASNQFFQLFIGLLIAAGVLNTILMSVLERTREFGVMMAVGMSPWRLFALVVTESVFIGLVGLLLGTVITVPWALYMHYEGLDMTAMYGEATTMNGVVFDPILRFHLPPEVMVGIVAALFLLTVLAGLYPAIRAARNRPIESLRVV